MKSKPNRWALFFGVAILAELGGVGWLLRELCGRPSVAAAAETIASFAREQNVLERRASALLAKMRSLERANQNFKAAAAPQRPAGAPRPLSGQTLRIHQALDDPEFLRNLALVQKSELDATYGPMFKQLNLSSTDLELLKDLLAKKKMAKLDTVIAAAQQGMSYEQYVKSAGDPPDSRDDQIQSLLGPDRYQLFNRYQGTLNTRLAVEDLQGNLSAAGAPLTGEQTESLITAWAAATPPDRQLNIYGGDPTPEWAVLTDAGVIPRSWDPDLLPNKASALALNLLTPQQMTVVQEAEQAKQALAQFLQLSSTVPALPSNRQQRRSPPPGN